MEIDCSDVYKVLYEFSVFNYSLTGYLNIEL